jgi:hypothetical protein
LKLNVTDQSSDNWYSLVEIPISSPKFIISQVAVNDENNRLDRADTAEIVLTIMNQGTVDAQNVSGVISTDDDYASVVGGSCSFGSVPVNGSATGTAVTIRASSQIFEGHTVNLLLTTTTDTGCRMTIPFMVPVGAVSTNDPTGPDAYGYYVYDWTDTSYSEVPTYDWIEIAPRQGGGSTRLAFSGNLDDNSVKIDIPFDFVYYGQTYRNMIVSINGFVAIDTAQMDMGRHYWANFFNWPIPDPGNAAGQISPFWDDLQLPSGSYKGIFTWHDTTSHLFYIEYDSLTNRNGGALERFEIIITDPAYHPTITGDSEIKFSYSIINNNSDSDENYSSIGMEDHTETVGLEYSYDRVYPPSASQLTNQKTIKITTNTGRGGIRGLVDLNNGGQNSGVVVRASSGQYRATSESGEFWMRNIPPGTVNVTAEIVGYFPVTLEDIEVVANQTMDNVDFSLAACPTPANLLATDSLQSTVHLTWDFISHPDIMGYDIYRSRWQNGVYTKLNTVPVFGNSYTDESVSDTLVYWYYVAALYVGPGWTAQSLESNKDSGRVLSPVGVSEEALIPREFFLSQNYPNPFNPTTSISYGLPKDSHVKIEIFNLLGQRVVVLADEYQRAGYRKVIWDGKDGQGEAVSSGMYLYRLRTDTNETTKKMMMLK